MFRQSVKWSYGHVTQKLNLQSSASLAGHDTSWHGSTYITSYDVQNLPRWTGLDSSYLASYDPLSSKPVVEEEVFHPMREGRGEAMHVNEIVQFRLSLVQFRGLLTYTLDNARHVTEYCRVHER